MLCVAVKKSCCESNRQIRELAARLITAQESERRRIALLLHDDVSQNIAALGRVHQPAQTQTSGLRTS